MKRIIDLDEQFGIQNRTLNSWPNQIRSFYKKLKKIKECCEVFKFYIDIFFYILTLLFISKLTG